MLSALYILDLKGRVIISRNYRGDVPFGIIEVFPRLLNEKEDEGLGSPILQFRHVSFIFIRFTNLYVVAVTKNNSNCMMIVAFMHKLCDVFTDYFQELEEESIKDNFVIVYELFDEVMDFGYPQFTTPKILQEYITQESHKLHTIHVRPPKALTNVVSWRSPGIKYKKNEVFVDVIESVNIMVGANGNVISSEVVGEILMRCQLSGMPELRLGLNDKILFQNTGRVKNKSIEMDDVKFHQCVSLARFENNRMISFIPPDGDFELMTYRVHSTLRPIIFVHSTIERHSHSRITFYLKAKTNFKKRSTANDVQIFIPVPAFADSPEFKVTVGTVVWEPQENRMLWSIRSFPGSKEYMLKAQFKLPSVDSEEKEDKLPITVKFDIPYHTISGIQVRYLKIMEKTGYHATPWVRYVTQNGDYQLRTK